MEVDIRHRLQPVRQGGFAAFVAIPQVFFHEGGQLGFQFSRVGAFPEHDVAMGRAPAPLVYLLVGVGLLDLEGREYVESEVRIGGQIGHDARHLEVKSPLGVQDLAHGVLVAEVLPGDGLGQHDPVVPGQRRLRIARQQGDVEHVENGRVGQVEVPLVEPLVPVFDHPGVPGRHKPDHVLYFREVFTHVPDRGDQDVRVSNDLAALTVFGGYAVGAVRPVEMPVIAQLVADEEHDEEAARDPERQARHVDERIALLPVQVAEGHGQVVS